MSQGALVLKKDTCPSSVPENARRVLMACLCAEDVGEIRHRRREEPWRVADGGVPQRQLSRTDLAVATSFLKKV